MSNLYNTRPSNIIGLEDDYTSYCFDEAVAYIIAKIKDGKEPKFNVKDENIDMIIEKPHFTKMSDLYKSMGFSYGEYKKEV